MIKQYDIFIVSLDPTIGSEIQKTRPCVVISPDEMNVSLQTVQVGADDEQRPRLPLASANHLSGQGRHDRNGPDPDG